MGSPLLSQAAPLVCSHASEVAKEKRVEEMVSDQEKSKYIYISIYLYLYLLGTDREGDPAN